MPFISRLKHFFELRRVEREANSVTETPDTQAAAFNRAWHRVDGLSSSAFIQSSSRVRKHEARTAPLLARSQLRPPSFTPVKEKGGSGHFGGDRSLARMKPATHGRDEQGDHSSLLPPPLGRGAQGQNKHTRQQSALRELQHRESRNPCSALPLIQPHVLSLSLSQVFPPRFKIKTDPQGCSPIRTSARRAQQIEIAGRGYR